MRQRNDMIPGQGGIRLFYRLWEPEQVQGNMILVHGAAEHTGRYEHVARWFAERGWAVWAMDHRGHGQSEGLQMHVDRFADYVADLDAFVDLATAHHGRPVMIGHSMGGLIAYHYAATHPEKISALVLSSPWFLAKAKVDPIQKALAPVLSAIMPRLQLPAGIKPEQCTRDTAMNARDLADQLMAKKTTPRWFMECTRAAAACNTSMTVPADLPVLFMQAGGDLLVDPEATRAVFNRLDHQRKTFRLYPDKYHEIFNDPGYEEVFGEVQTWLADQGFVQA